MTRRKALGWALFIAGTAVATLGHVIAYPAYVATAALTGFQLVGSVAGRGRPLPGARHLPRARPWLAVALSAVFALGVLRGTGLAWIGLGAVGFILLCEASTRLGAPSPVLGGQLVQAVVGAVYSLHAYVSTTGLGDEGIFVLVTILRAVLLPIAVLVAVHGLGLDRERLAAVGLTPWSPGEIAILPRAAVMALVLAISEWMYATFGDNLFLVWTATEAGLAAGVILALRYLDSRLRAAEAFAAARRDAKEAATP